VVETGRTLAPLVTADGHERIELTRGSGSNAGVRPTDRDAELDAFFAKTLTARLPPWQAGLGD